MMTTTMMTMMMTMVRTYIMVQFQQGCMFLRYVEGLGLEGRVLDAGDQQLLGARLQRPVGDALARLYFRPVGVRQVLFEPHRELQRFTTGYYGIRRITFKMTNTFKPILDLMK